MKTVAETLNIERTLSEALQKIKGTSEKEICRYLPADTEGYMHHFTLRKMKKTEPAKLAELLHEHIIDHPSPTSIEPKQRIRRKKSLSINQSDLNLILKLAQKTGDQHLLAKLGSKISISHLKKELIKSIKANRIEEELWYSYSEAVKSLAPSENED